MRSVSLASVGLAGDAKVLQKTLALYHDIERGSTAIDQNIKGVV